MKRPRADDLSDDGMSATSSDMDVVSAEHSAVTEKAQQPVVTASEDDQKSATQTEDSLACEVVPTLLPASSSWPDELRNLSFLELDDLFETACAYREDMKSVRDKAGEIMDKARKRVRMQKEGSSPIRTAYSLGAQFTAPYVGEALNFLHQYLCDACGEQYYHREILMIQSSGSGKSRLVTEATRQTLGILLNVRSPGDGGYPRCDEGIARQMISKGADPSRPLGVALMVCAVLESLTRHLQQQFEQHASYKEACANIASIFSTEGDERADQIGHILQRWKELHATCEIAVESAEAYRADRALPVTPDANRTPSVQWPKSSLKDREQIVMKHHILDALSGLHRVLRENEAKIEARPICVIIGIDEVQALHASRSDNLSFRRGMSRIFGLIERYQRHVCGKENGKFWWYLFFPLLSTQGRLDDLTEPQLRKPSDREGDPKLMNPFLAFPFDVHAAAKMDGDKPWMPKTLMECPTVDNLRLLGRPLWYLEDNESETLKFAWNKLYNDHVESFTQPLKRAKKWWETDGRCLAMLSRRLSLPFRFGLRSPHLGNSENLNLQVERHLRQLLYVSDNRSSRWSAATSEPVLSHVAFEGWICFFLMKGASEGTIVGTIFDLLEPYHRYAARNGGDVGEVAAQILIVAAADEAKLRQTPDLKIAEESTLEEGLRAAVRSHDTLPKMLRERVNHVVSVTAFLKCLLSRAAWASLEASENMPRFMEEMSSYFLYLTHFTRTFEDKKLETPADVRHLARRGAGIQTPPNYRATDLVIPIFRDGQLTDMTLLQVQVKNRAQTFNLNEPGWRQMEAQAMLSDGSVKLEGRYLEGSYATREQTGKKSSQTKRGHRWRLSIHGGIYRSISNTGLEEFLSSSDEVKNRVKQFGTQHQCNEYYDWSS